MSKWRKKPVVIEAFRWTGRDDQTEDPEWIIDAIKTGVVTFYHGGMKIHTLEGMMKVSVGDWVIKGVKGELYPCKPEIFEASYEAAGGEGVPTKIGLKAATSKKEGFPGHVQCQYCYKKFEHVCDEETPADNLTSADWESLCPHCNGRRTQFLGGRKFACCECLSTWEIPHTPVAAGGEEHDE